MIQPEPVPVLGQSGDSMPTSSTPACSRATFTKPPMYDRGSQASSASPLAGEPSWTKSSSVVSLGRNVTVSWTKFSTAMRPAARLMSALLYRERHEEMRGHEAKEHDLPLVRQGCASTPRPFRIVK